MLLMCGFRRRILRYHPEAAEHKCKLLQLAQQVAAWDEIEALVPQVVEAIRTSATQMRDCVQPLEATMNSVYAEEDLQWVTRTWADEIIWRLPGARETANALGPAPWLAQASHVRVGIKFSKALCIVTLYSTYTNTRALTFWFWSRDSRAQGMGLGTQTQAG